MCCNMIIGKTCVFLSQWLVYMLKINGSKGRCLVIYTVHYTSMLSVVIVKHVDSCTGTLSHSI